VGDIWEDERDTDDGLRGAVFDGVVDEIDEQLLDSGSIPGRLRGGLLRGGQNGFEANLGEVGAGSHDSDGVGDQTYGVEGFELVFFAGLFDAGVVEDVLDEAGESAAFLNDQAEEFLLLLWVGCDALLETLGEQADGGDGGAEFVGDTGDEPGLHFGELELF